MKPSYPNLPPRVPLLWFAFFGVNFAVAQNDQISLAKAAKELHAGGDARQESALPSLETVKAAGALRSSFTSTRVHPVGN